MDADKGLNQLIASALIGGVVLAILVVTAGGSIFILSHFQLEPHYRIFVGEPHYLRSLPLIFSSAAKADPRAIIQTGVVLLVCVPILRVLLAMLGFLVQRDYKFVAISAIVFCALVYSLVAMR